MAADVEFAPRLGTALATFTQTGTYSNTVQLNGRLVGLYSDNWPSAGTFTFRSSFTPAGTGWPVQSWDGTAYRLSAFGSGTFYTIGGLPYTTQSLTYLVLQCGTPGTAGVAAGGTVVLVTEQR